LGELGAVAGSAEFFVLTLPLGGGEGGAAAGMGNAASRAEELGIEFYNVAPTGMKTTLSLPWKPVTFSAVTREGVTVINVNNPRIYRAFLQATEEGTIALRPGEFVGSPPIPKGKISFIDWGRGYIHSETQGELELSRIFDLTGEGTAGSFPSPGCYDCVPHLAGRGVTHLNPKQ
jgi:hypothetical protein